MEGTAVTAGYGTISADRSGSPSSKRSNVHLKSSVQLLARVVVLTIRKIAKV